MTTLARTALALCAAASACSTDYETFVVQSGSASSSSSSGTGGGTGAGGGGATGGGGGSADGGGGKGDGGGGGGGETGVHCGPQKEQCMGKEVCCHNTDEPGPGEDICTAGTCEPEWAPVSCDEQSDCDNPTTVCCASFGMGKLLEVSCQPACSGPEKFFICSGGTICQLPTTCKPVPALGAFYSFCK